MNFAPEALGCKEGNFQVSLSDTVRSVYNSYVHFKWQKSNVGGTVWADMGEVPPVYDQSSGLGGGGELILIDEYGGGVDNTSAARDAVVAMGDANLALLGGHGVFVLGSTIRAVHQRAVALEQRCQRAWHIRAAGGRKESAVPDWWLERGRTNDGNGFIGFWEAMARMELRADPSILEER